MYTGTYFSINRIKALSALSRGAKVHVIGVCGVAMAQLAVLLSKEGYDVSGSDKEFYEPMGTLLRRSKVRLLEGYQAENVPADTALAVIGNAVSYGHPEVLEVERRNLPYSIFPRLLNELVIRERHSIVVAGTHGKTTTSGLMASVLLKSGRDPGYFIGGIVNDLPDSLARGSGAFSVVEGDEYDSAFFAKVPKFCFYRPDTVILTSVEYDHADIYPDLESVKRQFNALVQLVPARGRLVCCSDDENIAGMLPKWREDALCRITTYGRGEGADYRLLATAQDGQGQQVKVIEEESGEKFSLKVPLSGAYNALNALAVYIVSEELGLKDREIENAIGSFAGVKRRQEVRYQGGVTLIEDFAHHPTAVRETLQGVRRWFPDARIWAVFEPRSNTSRRAVFKDAYIHAFKEANRAVLCAVEARSIDQGLQLLDVAELGEAIKKSGVAALTLPDADSIFTHITSNIQKGDVVLLMSNGAFGGLPARLEEEFRAKGM